MMALARILAAASMAVALTAPAAVAKQRGGSPLLPGGDAHAPVSVKADQLEYFSKQRKAVYKGHVVARQGEGELRAASLTIFFSEPARGSSGAAGDSMGQQGASQVVRMEAAGPVTITQKDQVGVGDSASYERAANRVVLQGNVSLTQGPDIVKGDRLIYDLSNGQAQVVGRVSSLFVPGASGESSPGGERPRKPHERGGDAARRARPF